jgi:hypothetical protein
MENLDTLPTKLTLNVDGKPVVVTIPAQMVGRTWTYSPLEAVDLPQITDADAKVTLKEWNLLDSLAWDDYNNWSPDSVNIIGIACWSWSVCDGAGLGRGGGGVVASLVKKGLVQQTGSGSEAALGFTLLGWVTWLTVRNRRIARGAEVRTR